MADVVDIVFHASGRARLGDRGSFFCQIAPLKTPCGSEPLCRAVGIGLISALEALHRTSLLKWADCRVNVSELSNDTIATHLTLDLAIDLGAEQYYEYRKPHPGKNYQRQAQRAIYLAVAAEVMDIDAEQDRANQP
jgi:hypothetical protein